MDVQPIGNDKLLIYIDNDDMKLLPAPPSALTTSEAADILRRALGDTYDKCWESVCFELFPGRDSLLLFALKHSGSPSYFTFTDIEPLISAANACPKGLISYLASVDDGYVLVIYPLNGQKPPKVLFEYGEELRRPTHYALHLSEHSDILAGPMALDELCRAFS